VTRIKKHRRVSWKARRVKDGWLPVVLIGEEPIAFPTTATRHEARDIARTKAKQIGSAGPK